MASQLLRFLNERLRYISNLSEFDKVHDKTFEVLEYRNDSKHKKLNRAVVYASRFWMYHISESELTPNRYLDPQELKKWAKNQVQVIQQLKEFFQHGRLLSWVVVLDCSGVIEEVRLQLKKVKLWLANLQSSIIIKALKTDEGDSTPDVTGQWAWTRKSTISSLPSLQRNGSVVTEHVQYDERNHTEVGKLVEQSLQYLDTEEHKDQLSEARNAKTEVGSLVEEESRSNLEADPVQGLRQLMMPQYSDEVQKKAKDLVKALGR
ncbi:hypothetical protein C8R41DRAFT_917362 [Lentinula lateritia]|uniref:Uncharacterized protein n=1 Tax=Lentinula lateritia TaxID=40482 RepID=A0ABQ8VR25_9AGAR|nr:hypothetical protein C8R41DRAFT_917362 [Lentinula lateritia]